MSRSGRENEVWQGCPGEGLVQKEETREQRRHQGVLERRLLEQFLTQPSGYVWRVNQKTKTNKQQNPNFAFLWTTAEGKGIFCVNGCRKEGLLLLHDAPRFSLPLPLAQ